MTVEDLNENFDDNDLDQFFDKKIPTLYLYVKGSAEGCWHTIKDTKLTYIPQNQLSGHIERLECRKIEYDDKDAKKYKKIYSIKFRIHINQEDKRRVIIQSGIDTWFTKSIIPRLLMLQAMNTLNRPISLGVYQNESPEIIFGYIKQDGLPIKSSITPDEIKNWTEEDLIDMVDTLNSSIIPF